MIHNNHTLLQQYYTQKFQLRPFNFDRIRFFLSLIFLSISLFFGVCSIISYQRIYSLRFSFAQGLSDGFNMEMNFLKGRCNFRYPKSPHWNAMKYGDFYSYQIRSEAIKDYDSMSLNYKAWYYNISEDDNWLISPSTNIIAGIFFTIFFYMNLTKFNRLLTRALKHDQPIES